jgi:uncharacterized protein (TIGR03067 family)
MRSLALLLSLAAAATASAAPVPKAVKKPPPDPERFVGQWDVVSTELNGKPQANHAKVWTIDADLKMKSVHASGQVLNWAIKIDPDQSPKEIGIGSYKGIYEFDGDVIRIAYSTAGDRPTTFDPQPDVMIEVIRRAK